MRLAAGLIRAASSGAAFLLLLSGCASPDRFGGSREAVMAWAAPRGFLSNEVEARRFHLFGLIRGAAANEAVVYIEGDGAAWLSHYHPPLDPTPESPTALALAAADPSPLVAYLGRPCQYQSDTGLAACSPRYWTSHRFAPEVVAAYQEALDCLQREKGVIRFRLVGYSGGGVIAALLAQRRQDVTQLTTVAAPLAVRQWTAHHGVSDLNASLDPMTENPRSQIPQHHLVGEKDKIVPPAVVEAYALRHGGRVSRIPDFDHQCCWSRDWPQLLNLSGELR